MKEVPMHRECGLKLPSKIALVILDVRVEVSDAVALAESDGLKAGVVARWHHWLKQKGVAGRSCREGGGRVLT
jgi:hypothetical protein